MRRGKHGVAVREIASPFLQLVDEEAEESKLNSTGARKTIKFDG